MVGDPRKGVVDGPLRFGRDDDDLVPFPGKAFESRQGVVVGLEVAEQAPVAAVLGPLPEPLHVREVGEPVDPIPDLDGVEGDVSAEFFVVPADPAGVEVGDHAVEVDSEPEMHRRIVGGERVVEGCRHLTFVA